ncbi:MAG: CvpA family protein [Coprococcus sp.]|nr:CvpA family protein [Coprococcus sp.]
MNLLVLGILAFILLLVFRGYRKGFFKSAASAIGIVLAVLLTAILYPGVNKLLCQYTVLDDVIEQKIIEKFELPEETKTATRNEEINTIENLDLPDNVKGWLIANCNGETFLESGVDNVCSYIAKSLTAMVMRGISYVLTLLVLLLLLHILIMVLDVANYIPIVKSINKAGGAIFGAGQGILIVWIFMGIVTLLSTFSWAYQVIQMIDESPLLAWLYKKDIFLKIIVDILEKI